MDALTTSPPSATRRAPTAGVHRGPARGPRINVCRAIFMKALAEGGERLTKVEGKKRRVRVVVEMAMTKDGQALVVLVR